MRSRYSIFIITLSTFCIFYFWQFLNNNLEFLKNFFSIALIALLLSYGTYELVTKLINSLAIKSHIIKRLIMGNEYLDGKWVGYYFGAGKGLRYIIESFEQNLDGLVIRGSSYDEDFNLHSTWVSDAININPYTGKLAYTYAVTGCKDNYNGTGIADFSFIRTKDNSITHEIQGFSFDMHIAQRITSHEKKVEKGHLLSQKELLKKAETFYLEHSNPKK